MTHCASSMPAANSRRRVGKATLMTVVSRLIIHPPTTTVIITRHLYAIFAMLCEGTICRGLPVGANQRHLINNYQHFIFEPLELWYRNPATRTNSHVPAASYQVRSKSDSTRRCRAL